MKLTRIVLDNPIAGYVIVIFFVIFGIVMLTKLPIQLTPDIERLEVTITTPWRAAAPEEVEAEIIEPQEDALKGIPGVVKLLSEARRGAGSVTVTFETGYHIERALIEVINRLNRVSSYPVDADKPVLSTTGESARPIAWFIIKTTADNPRPIATYQRFIEEVVQARFERVWGVSLSEVRGGSENEVRITIDPYKAASFGINLPQTIQLVRGQEDISGGSKDIGKRSYAIRFEGAYKINTLSEMVVAWYAGSPVRLRDIATIERLPKDTKSFVINNNQRAVAVNAYRETGVNVLEVMTRLQATAEELATGPLAQAGLELEQVYDETIYISDAITRLFSNLIIGILLAGLVLWWFTRWWRLTLLVAVSIPLSLFAAFIVLQITGRTLNVISLAALALAVGMILDASIIALENILRLRESGKPLGQAALEGIQQIQPALVASTATTVAIFLPIVLLEDEAGQLFTDLAIGLSAAIIISLFAAVVIMPMLSQQWLHQDTHHDPFADVWDRWTAKLMGLTASPRRRTMLIAGLFIIPAILIILLFPKTDYLPAGQRNLVFAYLLPPPGINIETLENEIGSVVAQQLEPHLTGKMEPAIKHYFFVAFPRGAFMGARAEDPDKSPMLVGLFNGLFRDFPDTLAFARRASLFSSGNTRSIDVNLQGNDIETLLQAATVGYGLISQQIPGARINPRPGLELADPQLLLLPDEDRMAESGFTRETLGLISRAIGDGLYITDYFDGDKKIDVIARISNWETPEDLAVLPFVTPNTGVLPFGELVDIQRAAGPDRIRRLNRQRTITLEVIAPPYLSLEQTLAALKTKIEPVLRQQLSENATITYGGSADKLKTALSSMSGSFGLAIVILYLLITVLFRSFTDSLLVIACLPLAIVGGVLLLQLANWFTFLPLDLLTMIGFIILLGLVVNNAILLVHQSRQGERDGLTREMAIAQAIRLRLRPILMSTLTSLFGMLPLLLAFGAGAELYRGIAAVIVGGLSVSMIFTLVLIPCLLRIRRIA